MDSGPVIELRAKNMKLASSSEPTPPTTPTSLSTSAHQLLAEIDSINDTLNSLSSLEPCDKVNSLLTRLVSLCIVPYSAEFVSYFNNLEGVDALCRSIRPLCATAEGELEKYWANKILDGCVKAPMDSKQTRDLLHKFPYYANYLDLSHLETSLLSSFLPPPSLSSSSSLRIAFIGSGPLPLTSFCMLDLLSSSTIHNVDREASAQNTSQMLTKKLGYGERMTFACEDVSLPSSQTNWASFDILFLAALVGMDSPSKLSILKSLAKKLQPGTLLVARSARGLRGVLYPVLELGDGLQSIGLEVLAEVHPWTSVVNSVVVLRVKEM